MDAILYPAAVFSIVAVTHPVRSVHVLNLLFNPPRSSLAFLSRSLVPSGLRGQLRPRCWSCWTQQSHRRPSSPWLSTPDVRSLRSLGFLPSHWPLVCLLGLLFLQLINVKCARAFSSISVTLTGSSVCHDSRISACSPDCPPRPQALVSGCLPSTPLGVRRYLKLNTSAAERPHLSPSML